MEHRALHKNDSSVAEHESLRDIYNQGELNLQQYIGKGLLLAAARMDKKRVERGSEEKHVAALEKVLSSEEANSAYYQGFHGGSGSRAEKGEIGGLNELMKEHIGEQCAHHTFLTSLVKPGEQMAVRGYFVALQRDLHNAQLPDSLLAPVWLLKLQGQPLSRIYQTMDTFFDKSSRESLPGKEEEFWKKTIIGDNNTVGKEGIQFCLGYLAGNYPRIAQSMEAYYGDDFQEAMFDWSAVLYMNPRAVRDNSITLESTRQDIFLDLAVADLKSAKKRIIRLAQETPTALSEKYLRSLGFTRDQLIMEKVEYTAHQEFLREEREALENRNQSRERLLREIEQLRSTQQSESAAAEKVRPFLGTFFVLEESFFSGEEIVTTRRIIKLTDISSRPRYAGRGWDGTREEIRIPAINVWNYNYLPESHEFVFEHTSATRTPSKLLDLIQGTEVDSYKDGYGTLKAVPLEGIASDVRSLPVEDYIQIQKALEILDTV